MGKTRRFEILGFSILPFFDFNDFDFDDFDFNFENFVFENFDFGRVLGHGARARCLGTRPSTVGRSQVWKCDFPTSDPCVLTGVVLRTLKQSLWEKFVGLKF